MVAPLRMVAGPLAKIVGPGIGLPLEPNWSTYT